MVCSLSRCGTDSPRGGTGLIWNFPVHGGSSSQLLFHRCGSSVTYPPGCTEACSGAFQNAIKPLSYFHGKI